MKDLCNIWQALKFLHFGTLTDRRCEGQITRKKSFFKYFCDFWDIFQDLWDFWELFHDFLQDFSKIFSQIFRMYLKNVTKIFFNFFAPRAEFRKTLQCSLAKYTPSTSKIHTPGQANAQSYPHTQTDRIHSVQ